MSIEILEVEPPEEGSHVKIGLLDWFAIKKGLKDMETKLAAAEARVVELNVKLNVPWEVVGSLNFLEEYAKVRPKKFKQKIQKIRKFINTLPGGSHE